MESGKLLLSKKVNPRVANTGVHCTLSLLPLIPSVGGLPLTAPLWPARTGPACVGHGRLTVGGGDFISVTALLCTRRIHKIVEP